MATELFFNEAGACHIEDFKISSIRMDLEIHSRVCLNKTVICEYAEAMIRGASFPSSIAFFDGESYWLADGFHRLEARKLANFERFSVEIRSGDRRDAILFSSGLSSDYGLRRTNKDKRYVVTRLLQDPEWSLWSDNEIARRCYVTHPLVGKIRKALNLSCNGYKIESSSDDSEPTELRSMRKAQKGNKVYMINTHRIGKPSTSDSHSTKDISTLEKKKDFTSENDVKGSPFLTNNSIETNIEQSTGFQVLEVILESKHRSVDEPELVRFCPQILCKDKGESLLLILCKMAQYPDFANRVYQEAQRL